MDKKTDAELIEIAGKALYGDLWQRALARALDISERTVRYWAAGRNNIKPGVWDDVRTLLSDQEAKCQETAALIERERPTSDNS